jgi:succinate dehydrogenase / fumarate reductase cytochrome b subunit
MAELPSREIPRAFIWRKLHSLTGLWLVGFVIFHLFTNSQAALFLGTDGSGFIRSVNSIHELPYLPIIELAILAVPILIHGLWGIVYLRQAKYNSFGGGGEVPYLPEYPRNHAYTWQRITSWLLLVGIIAHVVHMRFIEYPLSAPRGIGEHGIERSYMVRITEDKGLYTLSKRLGVELYDAAGIQKLEKRQNKSEVSVTTSGKLKEFFSSLGDLFKKEDRLVAEPSKEDLLSIQKKQMQSEWLETLQKKPLREGEVIAVSDNFGTAELLMVRDTFKMPVMIALYTLFVLATCFHSFNGLWTAMIAWGLTLTERSQRYMRVFTTLLMVVVAFMGLSAIWFTYWINLK